MVQSAYYILAQIALVGILQLSSIRAGDAGLIRTILSAHDGKPGQTVSAERALTGSCPSEGCRVG